MPLHPNFPKSPYEILEPSVRWYPSPGQGRIDWQILWLPPLVQKIREEVHLWRQNQYEWASATSKSLLNWWFKTEHITTDELGKPIHFRYYFAQREALETVIYLYEVKRARDKYDLLRYDGDGIVSPRMFDEDWTRYVVKMATGAGKTKVMSLVLAWSYFHRLYEPESTLSRNFLVIAPNIIVLERIRADFDGLKIFFTDPVLPDNWFDGQNWRDDFQITLHIQDEVGAISDRGNIFLTNIHRVYDSDAIAASFEDENTDEYFLGQTPVGKTNENKVNLSDIVRDIDELVVINDEAHHIHDPKLAWFGSIRDIDNKLIQKGRKLSLQLDVTATPKRENGSIFVQVVSDYPLVEAIEQRVVKMPIIPDEASLAKLEEHKSAKYSEMYQDFIQLGYEEWKKTYNQLFPMGKKSVLFIMTDDTKNCDEVAAYLEHTYADLAGAVLTIHTNKSGDILEGSKKEDKEELTKLRKLSNEIDKSSNPYKVIVSVLMLREWWDVKNVTTIVGLRAFTSKNNVLPEQTLGRGLRRMFRNEDITEKVSIIGTPAFMEFVKKIEEEGVTLTQDGMWATASVKAPMLIEIDHENVNKDLEWLDIELPILSPRIRRDTKKLDELRVINTDFVSLTTREYSDVLLTREIQFEQVVSGQADHTVEITPIIPNGTNVIGYFTRTILQDLRLLSTDYPILYGKVKEFIKFQLFAREVDLEDIIILRNLTETVASRTIFETFRKAINAFTVVDTWQASIVQYSKISKTRPFVVKDQWYYLPQKSIFNKIVGDSHFELEFGSWLDTLSNGEIVCYAKNYLAIEFKIDYQNTDGSIAHYYPDFFVKIPNGKIYIVELKGREDLDDILKVKRLFQYCEDINNLVGQKKYIPLYIKQYDWEVYRPKSFEECLSLFQK